EGARETEDILRDLAHRVREYGVIANERLANFVKAANGCAELARTMQGRLEHFEEELAAEAHAETEASATEPATATVDRRYEDALAAEIEGAAHEGALPTQPAIDPELGAERPFKRV